MTKKSIILICVSVVLTQLVVVNSADLPKTEDIDWTTVHEDLKKIGASFRKKCMAETGATLSMLEDAEMGEFSTDPKLACYFKCVAESGGVMKKDGKINHKILAKLMPSAYRHIGVQMMEECKTIEGSDKCDKALNFNKCMYNANPVAYFVV